MNPHRVSSLFSFDKMEGKNIIYDWFFFIYFSDAGFSSSFFFSFSYMIYKKYIISLHLMYSNVSMWVKIDYGTVKFLALVSYQKCRQIVWKIIKMVVLIVEFKFRICLLFSLLSANDFTVVIRPNSIFNC